MALQKLSWDHIDQVLSANPYVQEINKIMNSGQGIQAVGDALGIVSDKIAQRRDNIRGQSYGKDCSSVMRTGFNVSAPDAAGKLDQLDTLDIGQAYLESISCDNDDDQYLKLNAAVQGYKLNASPSFTTSLRNKREAALADNTPKDPLTVKAII